MKKILKKIIPIELRIRLRKLKSSFSHYLVIIAGYSYLSSGLFYFLFNRSFRAEHKAVLQGRIAFVKYSIEPQISSPQLRRNIHRLEKGLIMKPRKAVFGEAFILETIDLYRSVLAVDSVDKSEVKWAKDVLSSYFSVVADTKVIVMARSKYSKIIEEQCSVNANELKFVPYKRSEAEFSKINYPDLLGLCQQRRSVRWYKQELVPDDLINKAIEVARTAPSACNRQPFEFLVINNKEHASDIIGLPAGTSGFSGQVPCAVVVIGDLSCYPTEVDRHVMYIDASLSSMQFMLALETLGLSSCAINWPENENKENSLEKIIPLPKHKRVIMMMSVGYADPDGMIPFSSKKSLSSLRTSIKKYKS